MFFFCFIHSLIACELSRSWEDEKEKITEDKESAEEEEEEEEEDINEEEMRSRDGPRFRGG